MTCSVALWSHIWIRSPHERGINLQQTQLKLWPIGNCSQEALSTSALKFAIEAHKASHLEDRIVVLLLNLGAPVPRRCEPAVNAATRIELQQQRKPVSQKLQPQCDLP